MGIKKYNELCRGIVSRYAKEWEEIVSRLGRWIGKSYSLLSIKNIYTNVVIVTKVILI